MRASIVMGAMLGLLVSTGCQAYTNVRSTSVEYQPDRALVEAISPEQARGALADVLSRGWTRRGSGAEFSNPLEEIDVGEDGFSYTADVYRGFAFFKDEQRRTFRYDYRDLSPRAYEVMLVDAVMVSLYGPNPGTAADPIDDCFWLDEMEDVQTCIDGLEVLKRDALARNPRSGPEPSEDETQ